MENRTRPVDDAASFPRPTGLYEALTPEPARPATAELRVRDERLVTAFATLLFEPPWWWQAAGHTEEEWHRDRQRRVIANQCPVRIHDDAIFCDLPIGPIGPDGLARCADTWIKHVLRPTGNPDNPWSDTGRRERVSR